MKVKDIMTSEPKTCSPDTTLADAARLMWESDCGILPVVEDGKLMGVATDRDMYVALATRNKLASEITIGEVATRKVATCEPEESVQAALATMKTHRVRRLPVVGFSGTVVGVLSMNDIVLADRSLKAAFNHDIVETLQAICGRHHVAPHVVVA